MCMHLNMQTFFSHVEQMNAEELDQLQEAILRRRHQIGDKPVSTVVERRNYGNGILQLERRAYRRKDAKLTERGPYWYFHFRERARSVRSALARPIIRRPWWTISWASN